MKTRTEPARTQAEAPLFVNSRPGNWGTGRLRKTNRLRARLPALHRRNLRAFGKSPWKTEVHKLARDVGIQASYVDMAGKKQTAALETIKALLQVWGFAIDSEQDVRDARHELIQERARERLPPVVVAWDSKASTIEVRLPASIAPAQLLCSLKLEDGTRHEIQATQRSKPAQANGVFVAVKSLKLPSLPFGYHQLELETSGRIDHSLIISAPTRSYSPENGQKVWGVFLPMYAAHSKRSWGAGDLTDWRHLSAWIASLGGSVMATLPMLASFLSNPIYEPSPYSPVSRLFWNEFYLDVTASPEFESSPGARKLVSSPAFQRRLASFRQEPLVNYREQMATRREVLELLATQFLKVTGSRRQKFERFVSKQPLVKDYAEFRAACEQSQSTWHRWEPRMQFGKLQPCDFSEEARNYHLYAQFLTEEQMSSLLEDCRRRGMQSYLDLPLGVHLDGYDLWRHRDAFAFPCSVGAPPDPVFTQGQNWGFAPLHPQRIRYEQYKYVMDYVRFQMRHTGMIRVDHVMGLHRLYWIPQGFSASQGAYVSYRSDELHAILSLESHRNQTVLVGENLGTVPPEVNEAMSRHGLRQMYVTQYEQGPDPKKPLRTPPRASIASLNTHDMPPFAAFWKGMDIQERARLGLVKDMAKSLAERQKGNEALVQFLRKGGWLKSAPPPDEKAVVHALLAWLAASPAEVMLVNLEDLWAETKSQNLPGTSQDKPNWRRKAKFTIHEMLLHSDFREVLTKVNNLRTAKEKAEG